LTLPVFTNDGSVLSPSIRHGNMTTMNLSPQPPPLPPGVAGRPPAFSPMLLSALVYPGAGQLMQKRWGVGVGFALAFTVPLVWFVIEVFRVLSAYYAFMVDFKGATGVAPGATAIVVPFLLSLALYVAGLVDTALAAYRIRMKSRVHPTF
jgi:hypothetical protein